ncbi:hypothetical protein F5148DRAFT_1235477 [Russula earlei]|uniref:Uncharacterized protein n=1 Tax=Russula earlei TaxID=71964 RepID=A0ACC0TXE2_9AGAM|nr:hypothetical protein F5148DRAFT_1235477 [Russula earlei]
MPCFSVSNYSEPFLLVHQQWTPPAQVPMPSSVNVMSDSMEPEHDFEPRVFGCTGGPCFLHVPLVQYRFRAGFQRCHQGMSLSRATAITTAFFSWSPSINLQLQLVSTTPAIRSPAGSLATDLGSSPRDTGHDDDPISNRKQFNWADWSAELLAATSSLNRTRLVTAHQMRLYWCLPAGFEFYKLCPAV